MPFMPIQRYARYSFARHRLFARRHTFDMLFATLSSRHAHACAANICAAHRDTRPPFIRHHYARRAARHAAPPTPFAARCRLADCRIADDMSPAMRSAEAQYQRFPMMLPSRSPARRHGAMPRYADVDDVDAPLSDAMPGGRCCHHHDAARAARCPMAPYIIRYLFRAADAAAAA